MSAGETVSGDGGIWQGKGTLLPAAEAVVLIIEDDPHIREAMIECLSEERFRVAAVADGQEALEALAAGLQPDTILLDVMMPRMDGWEFRQRQLRDRRWAEIPTIVCSATGFARDTVRRQFGDVEFVEKPFRCEQLLTLLDRFRQGSGGARRSGT